ncbi:hypothetical protein [Duganella vulcania]|uniref:Uncharacterized protein n=1 Tax=Duganella vulcania TaxID=2692166 RepID=A0A845GII4_9BURK|nr:hypothetical protein [Duganella vulcania]MYM92577.1 hypothetical protein [Duganella vulcania]
METAVAMLLVAALGYLAGRQGSRPSQRATVSVDAKVKACSDLLCSILKYEQACSTAVFAAESGQINDSNKVAVSDAGSELIRWQLAVGFIVPSEVHEAVDSIVSDNFGKSWDERLGVARTARQTIVEFARREFGPA